MHGLADIRRLNNKAASPSGLFGVQTLDYEAGEIVAYGPFTNEDQAVVFGRGWQAARGDDPNWNTFRWPRGGPRMIVERPEPGRGYAEKDDANA